MTNSLEFIPSAPFTGAQITLAYTCDSLRSRPFPALWSMIHLKLGLTDIGWGFLCRFESNLSLPTKGLQCYMWRHAAELFGQVGYGQYCPRASISQSRKENTWFMVLRVCFLLKSNQYRDSVPHPKLILNTILIFSDKVLHYYYMAEVYFVLLPSKIVKMSIKTITIYKYFSISLDNTISFWEPSIWDKCTDYNLNVNYK